MACDRRAVRVAPIVDLTNEERATLEQMSRGRTTEARLVLRAKLVLAAAEGKFNKDIAIERGTGRKAVSMWRRRFVEGRVVALEKDRTSSPWVP